MKEALELFGAIAAIIAIAMGALLFIAGIYLAVFGTLGGVIYLLINGIVGLFS